MTGAALAYSAATFDLKVMEEEASVDEVARTILNYLRENPEAQDTLEGVVQWWLPDEQHQRRTATIKEALDQLCAVGLINEHKGKDGQVSYRVMRDGAEAETRGPIVDA